MDWTGAPHPLDFLEDPHTIEGQNRLSTLHLTLLQSRTVISRENHALGGHQGTFWRCSAASVCYHRLVYNRRPRQPGWREIEKQVTGTMEPRRCISLTPKQVSTIEGMASKNNSSGTIAVSVDVKKSTFAYVAKFVRGGAGVAKVDRRGRPPLISPRDIRTLARTVEFNRFSSVEESTRQVNATLSRPVSPRTVQRAMHKLGFKSATPATKPWVSDVNKATRVAWAKERRHWDEEWTYAFFTEESSFEVKRPSCARVWRWVGERFQPSCLRPSFKNGRQSLMVWAGFSARGRTPLRRVIGSMNSDQYEEVLAEDMLNYIVAHYGAPDAAWPQEDLAPCHASKRCKAAKVALGLKHMPWLGQVPDLNPIENAWNELDRRLRSRKTSPKNLVELWEALCKEWGAIPASFFTSLIQSMPRRVQAVVAAKGSGTKY